MSPVIRHKSKRITLVSILSLVSVLALQPLLAGPVSQALSSSSSVIVNELMPNPVEIGDVEGEWIELKNNSNDEVDISGWEVAGVTIADEQSIAGGGLYVLCQSEAANTECDGVDEGLVLTDTGGVTVELSNAEGDLVDSFTYDGSEAGQSIEVVRENGVARGENNASSAYSTNEPAPQAGNTGTPGAENHAQPAADAVKNLLQERSAPSASNLQVETIRNGNLGGTVRITLDLVDENGVTVNKKYTFVKFHVNGKEYTYAFQKVEDDEHTSESVIDTRDFVPENKYVAGVNVSIRYADELNKGRSLKADSLQGIGIDNSGPGAKLLAPSSGSAINGTQKFKFKMSDHTGVSGGYVKLVNKATGKSYDRPIESESNDIWFAEFDTTKLADGEYRVDIRPKDSFGTPRYGSNKGTVSIDNSAPVVLSSEISELSGANTTSAAMNQDGRLKLTITTDEPIAPRASTAFMMRTTADGGEIVLPRVKFEAAGENTYVAYFDLEHELLAGKETEKMRIRLQLRDELRNATSWLYVAQEGATFKGEDSPIYKFTVDNQGPVISGVLTDGVGVTGAVLSGVKNFQVDFEDNDLAYAYVEYMRLEWNENKQEILWSKKYGKAYKNIADPSFTIDTTKWDDGTYQIKVSRIKDGAGNNSATKTFGFTVDNNGPSLSVDSPVDEEAAEIGDTIQVLGTATDFTGVDRVVVYLSQDGERVGDRVVIRDLDETGEWSALFETEGLVEGRYRVIVDAYDVADNPVSTERRWIDLVEAKEEVLGESTSPDSTDVSSSEQTPGGESSDASNSGSQSSRSGNGATTSSSRRASFNVQPASSFAYAPVYTYGAVQGFGYGGAAAQSSDEAEDEEEVLAANDERAIESQQEPAGDNEVIGDENEEAGFLSGIAWYWWPLIALPFAIILWWIIAGLRRRSHEE